MPEQSPPYRPVVSQLALTEPRFRPVVRHFAQQLPAQLVAMREALARGDFGVLAAAAHRLKGGGGSVGFHEFTEPAARLWACANAADPGGSRAALEALADIVQRIELPDETPQHTASR